jgi:hypothetical protein
MRKDLEDIQHHADMFQQILQSDLKAILTTLVMQIEPNKLLQNSCPPKQEIEESSSPANLHAEVAGKQVPGEKAESISEYSDVTAPAAATQKRKHQESGDEDEE